jgi:cis-3-alkyl-4-acyloxetan-2-one decarboxylase
MVNAGPSPSAFPAVPEWLAGEFPFRPKVFITSRGARMTYLDEGAPGDEIVLMVHGNPTWSFYYRHLVSALSGNHRCIAPDHVGMGLSDKPGDYDYRLARRIADLEALVLSLKAKRVHLVVHDWGGAIGFGFAARHPMLIGRLTILNTAAFASSRIPARIALCRAPLIGDFIVRHLNGFAGPATTMAMHRRELSPVEKRAYLFPYDTPAHRVAVSAFVRDIPMRRAHGSWAALAAVEQGLAQFRDRPALIVWGGRDFCFNDTFLARWREVLPQARVHRIADAGHYVLEDAREEAVPLIRDFLRPA